MNDMHIHLKEGINDAEIFKKYVEKCLQKGFTSVVFLDHGNRISPKHKEVLADKETIDKFNKRIINFNKKQHDLKIIRGIEIDYSPNITFREKTNEILKIGNFEWIVGAIHSLKFDSLGGYLDAVIDMINNYDINVIAHLKLDDSFKEYEDKLIEIIKLCHAKNIFIEINTSDRSRWNDSQLDYMLDLMNKYDVEYVLGSDAHQEDDIGYYFDEVKQKIDNYKEKKVRCKK